MEKLLNVILLTQKKVDGRKDKNTVWYFGIDFRADGSKALIEDNLYDALAVLRSAAPLRELVPPDWNGNDMNTRFIDDMGTVYPQAYNINNGTVITESYWDYAANLELQDHPKKYQSFLGFFNEVVSNWMKATGLEFTSQENTNDNIVAYHLTVTVDTTGGNVPTSSGDFPKIRTAEKK